MTHWLLPMGFALLCFLVAGRIGWRYPITVTVMLVLCMAAEACGIRP